MVFDVRYYCPKCRAPIVWSLNNLNDGARAPIRCANNVVASRIDFDPRHAIFCEWTGVAIRQQGGGIKLFQADGITLLRPRI